MQYILLLMMAVFLVGCSSTEKKEFSDSKPEILYERGMSYIVGGKYDKAIEYFEGIENEHPAAKILPEVMIQKAYAYYKAGKYIDVVFVFQNFVRQYPSHKRIGYMYYLHALSYYDQIVDPERDQSVTFEAMKALKDVVTRFPASKYARDAKLKIEYAMNHLAAKEMNVAYFYLQQGNTAAAVSRYSDVIDKYETSIFIPEALYRLTEIYYSMGIYAEAQKYAAVLGHNYPRNEWYEKAFTLVKTGQGEDKKPWYKKAREKIW